MTNYLKPITAMKHILSFLVLAMISLVIVSCGGESKQDPLAKLSSLKEQKSKIDAEITALETQLIAEGKIEKKIRTIALTAVQPTSFKHYIDLQGKVEAEETVMATSQVPGTLKHIYVKNGDVVKKGQLLAELDDAVMQKSIAEVEGQLVTARDLFTRQQSLWDQKIGSEVQYIQAKNNVESLERSLATLKENWSMNRVKAPTSGTVDMVQLKVGQAIAPGMPLCAIVNLSNLKMVGNVTEAYISKVKKGDKVQLYFPDTDKEITTTISFVSKIISPQTRTFTVESKLPAGDYRSNQIAVLKIVDYSNPKAITIPVNLIQTDPEGDYVLVIEKGQEAGKGVVKKRVIKQGQNYRGQVEVIEGLQPGDEVISTGYQEIVAGETVAF